MIVAFPVFIRLYFCSMFHEDKVWKELKFPNILGK